MPEFIPSGHEWTAEFGGVAPFVSMVGIRTRHLKLFFRVSPLHREAPLPHRSGRNGDDRVTREFDSE